MFCLFLAGAAALGVGSVLRSSGSLGCRSLSDYCWRENPKAFDCMELPALLSSVENGSMCWLLDPVEASVEFLNNCFIIGRYRSRPAYLHECKRVGDKAYVLLTFDDGEEMAFELCRPEICGCKKLWIVCRYSYASLCN